MQILRALYFLVVQWGDTYKELGNDFFFDFSKNKFVSKIAYSPGPSFKNVKFDIFYVKVA